ncbi:hypothetical protein JG687_00016081 [Phytophthora cactorum]|uniref:DOT1 domain-containing protein n=1 Tax=Phytophthora cactorum TaxID=29920 RepID=A0A8T1TT71_9STRA|nr:hypothetical protein JG687_00016081 [Phytophthora cactorum]
MNIIGPVAVGDVFLDIGCGIGNTAPKRCIGIEIRHELSQLGSQLIQRYSNVQPLLKDAKETGLSVRQPYFDACIVYLNSFLFANDIKLFVLSELCTLPRARIVVSTEKFCPRHRTPCRNAFCATWQLHQVTSGQVSWTIKPVSIYIYKRV